MPTYDLEDADRRLGYELRENLDAEHDAQDRRADYAEVVPLHTTEPGEADYPDNLSPRAQAGVAKYVTELACRAADLHCALAHGAEVSADYHERVERSVITAVDAALFDVVWDPPA